jgi:hypothetical protein
MAAGSLWFFPPIFYNIFSGSSHPRCEVVGPHGAVPISDSLCLSHSRQGGWPPAATRRRQPRRSVPTQLRPRPLHHLSLRNHPRCEIVGPHGAVPISQPVWRLGSSGWAGSSDF